MIRPSPQLVRAAGQILTVSYPVLALSAGARAIYQLFFKPGVSDYFPPTLSAVAALAYLLATLGFIVRRPWAWYMAVVLLGLETLGVLTVGTWSVIEPAFIGRTVWHLYGVDYGFLPLIQPVLGLIWLFYPENRALYWRQAQNAQRSTQNAER